MSFLNFVQSNSIPGLVSNVTDMLIAASSAQVISETGAAFAHLVVASEPYSYEQITPSPFIEHKNCQITLFQDAHVGSNISPTIPNDLRRLEQTQNAMETIYRAIKNAKHFVYITGWSVDQDISLLRYTTQIEESETILTIGELLKEKASNGVKVQVHVWNEALSMNIAGYQTAGVVGTKDELMKQYFDGTSVEVQLSYRDGSSQENGFVWSHHQKTVIVDADIPTTTSFLSSFNTINAPTIDDDNNNCSSSKSTHDNEVKEERENEQQEDEEDEKENEEKEEQQKEDEQNNDEDEEKVDDNDNNDDDNDNKEEEESAEARKERRRLRKQRKNERQLRRDRRAARKRKKAQQNTDDNNNNDNDNTNEDEDAIAAKKERRRKRRKKRKANKQQDDEDGNDNDENDEDAKKVKRSKRRRRKKKLTNDDGDDNNNDEQDGEKASKKRKRKRRNKKKKRSNDGDDAEDNDDDNLAERSRDVNDNNFDDDENKSEKEEDENKSEKEEDEEEEENKSEKDDDEEEENKSEKEEDEDDENKSEKEEDEDNKSEKDDEDEQSEKEENEDEEEDENDVEKSREIKLSNENDDEEEEDDDDEEKDDEEDDEEEKDDEEEEEKEEDDDEEEKDNDEEEKEDEEEEKDEVDEEKEEEKEDEGNEIEESSRAIDLTPNSTNSNSHNKKKQAKLSNRSTSNTNGKRVLPKPTGSTEIFGDKRRIIAFVGGLDLTNGRWDTPCHCIYKSLGVEHKQDFYQAWGLDQSYGPRQPWHDIHSRLEGPVARDVMLNFEQRWEKQATTPKYQMDETKFINEQEESELLKQLYGDFNGGLWNAKIVRSIDQFSAPIEGKEMGIQKAYIEAIRSAKEFIYVENQYFLGGAAHWLQHKGVQAHNLIPYEIASRIATAISNDQRFVAYIVIPLFPEGKPETTALQEILKWQWCTIEMMYSIINKAIREKNIAAHPQDYLNFYSPGQRESLASSTAAVSTPDALNHPIESALLKTRRFMIYVHSKMMIVDDDTIIVGSANINERSMAGNRDTEIAMVAYQPNNENNNNKQNKEAIHKFRISLWTEHIGTYLPEFLDPTNINTVKKINEIADKNWNKFSSEEEVIEMKESHLMHYPLAVSFIGSISPLSPFFPDTIAKINGTDSPIMPDKLTT